MIRSWEDLPPHGALYLNSLDWAVWWTHRAVEHDAAARSLLPSADSWDPPAPAFVGGAA